MTPKTYLSRFACSSRQSHKCSSSPTAQLTATSYHPPFTFYHLSSTIYQLLYTSTSQLPQLPPPATMASGHADQQRETAKYTCLYPNCGSCFGRRQELERHEREYHGPPQYCPVLNCNYQTQRMARLRKHLETSHGYSHQGNSSLTLSVLRKSL